MGVLDDLLGGALDNLWTPGGRDRGLERLAADGELVPATIYAIRIVSKSDTADEWTYGLDLVSSSGPLRASVRQQLIPDAWRAPLGARVLARHLNGRVAIDWPANLREAGIEPPTGLLAGKTLKKPIEPGIHDDYIDAKRLRNGTRMTAEVLSSEQRHALGMPTDRQRMRLRLDDGRDIDLDRAYLPDYARALAEPGARLPVAVDPKKPDRVTIDWAAAAEASAGLGG